MEKLNSEDLKNYKGGFYWLIIPVVIEAVSVVGNLVATGVKTHKLNVQQQEAQARAEADHNEFLMNTNFLY